MRRTQPQAEIIREPRLDEFVFMCDRTPADTPLSVAIGVCL